MTQVKISLDEECLVAVIANASNIKNRILIVSQAITANPKNIALTENLLSALPKPYSDIAVHDRKHPILENNGPNLRLLDALKKHKIYFVVQVFGKRGENKQKGLGIISSFAI